MRIWSFPDAPGAFPSAPEASRTRRKLPGRAGSFPARRGGLISRSYRSGEERGGRRDAKFGQFSEAGGFRFVREASGAPGKPRTRSNHGGETASRIGTQHAEATLHRQINAQQSSIELGAFPRCRPDLGAEVDPFFARVSGLSNQFEVPMKRLFLVFSSALLIMGCSPESESEAEDASSEEIRRVIAAERAHVAPPPRTKAAPVAGGGWTL